MLYLDTSCLMKLLFHEAESARTVAMVATEDRVVVSDLGRLEAMVQIRGRVAGGTMTARRAGQLSARLRALTKRRPFEILASPPDLIALAEKQLGGTAATAHCRTLDRFHLTAMEAFGIKRLLTNDDIQARAARALGFEVKLPR